MDPLKGTHEDFQSLIQIFSQGSSLESLSRIKIFSSAVNENTRQGLSTSGVQAKKCTFWDQSLLDLVTSSDRETKAYFAKQLNMKNIGFINEMSQTIHASEDLISHFHEHLQSTSIGLLSKNTSEELEPTKNPLTFKIHVLKNEDYEDYTHKFVPVLHVEEEIQEQNPSNHKEPSQSKEVYYRIHRIAPHVIKNSFRAISALSNRSSESFELELLSQEIEREKIQRERNKQKEESQRDREAEILRQEERKEEIQEKEIATKQMSHQDSLKEIQPQHKKKKSPHTDSNERNT